MGWLIAAVIILLIIWFRVGVRVRYNSAGAQAWALFGPVKLRLWPRKKKEKKPQEIYKEKPQKEPKKKSTPQKKKSAQPVREEPEEKGGSVKDFIPLVRLGLDFLKDLRRKLRIKKLTFRVILAEEDPCDLAVHYGKTWAAVSNFMPVLDQFLVIGSRDVEVECDFAADQTRIIAGADITITIGRACILVMRYGIRTVREIVRFQNKRKGGAVK